MSANTAGVVALVRQRKARVSSSLPGEIDFESLAAQFPSGQRGREIWQALRY